MTRAGSIPRTEPPAGGATPPAEALPPYRVIDAIREAGLLSDRALAGKGVLVEQAGRSHQVYRISLGGRPFAYLKSFGPSRGETDGSPAREAALAALAADREPVAAIHPEHLPWRGRPGVIVTRAVEGHPAWADATGAPTGGDWEALVGMTAPPLAAFHRGTRDLAAPGAVAAPALAGPVPWVLRLFSGDAPPELWADPRIGAVLGAAGRWTAITEGIRAARDLWRPICVIHADLKHDNILVTREGVVFLDWEMARLGDPCWDLAALASHLPLMDDGDTGFGAAVIAGTAGLVRAYADESGLRRQALARRIVPYLGAWLLMAALQHRSTGADAETDEGVASIFRKAAHAFTQTECLTRAITEAAP